MSRRITLYNLTRRLWLPAVLAVIAYSFVNSLVFGENGIRARQATEAELAEKTAELQALQSERERLEKNVSLLSPGSLDPDLLDEEARSVLGLAGEKELVVILDEEDDASGLPETPED